MTKLTLAMKKTTDNKVVFGQLIPENSLEVSLIPSLYIDKRDLAQFGVTEATPRLEVSIKAVA